jgi:hypothetical protein
MPQTWPLKRFLKNEFNIHLFLWFHNTFWHKKGKQFVNISCFGSGSDHKPLDPPQWIL